MLAILVVIVRAGTAADNYVGSLCATLAEK
jgi:hypothetical protein